MYVTKPYSENTYRKNKEEPAWHLVNGPIYSFTKTIKATCGLNFVLGTPTRVKEKLSKNDRPCGQCLIIKEGTKLRQWASTGLYKSKDEI